MADYQQQFIDFILDNKILTFGDFTLKSGRISPYFFNIGLLNRAEHLSQLGSFYAQVIRYHQINFDVIFGPAYKGIPLACATAIALYNEYHIDVGYSFDRKEVKDHGEGGDLVGHPLNGQVIIVDDVITQGNAITHSVALIRAHKATPVAVITAIDRQERGIGDKSATEEIWQLFHLPVYSIITLSDIIDYLQQDNQQALVDKMAQYRARYGV